MSELSGSLNRTREYFESQLKQYLDEDHDDPDLRRWIDDGLAVCDALTLTDDERTMLAELRRLQSESLRLRTCETCELVGGETCSGLRCDECYSILEHRCEQQSAEIARLQGVIDVLDRKQRHGCTDANCEECDL